MIYLSPTNRSSMGEETWWIWFERHWANTTYAIPSVFQKGDVMFRYSDSGGFDVRPGKLVAMCWDFLPELKRVFNNYEWDGAIARANDCARRADRRIIVSEFVRKDYEQFGRVDYLPAGVDTDLFYEYADEGKRQMKLKYNIPLDKEVGFWCGTTHPMKGYNYLLDYAKENPDIYWIVVWYEGIYPNFRNSSHYNKITQQFMPELMNCADFQLMTSIIRPYCLVEYEGMACNLKQRRILNVEKDFEAGDNPRDVIFERKWDRKTCKILYEEFINTL